MAPAGQVRKLATGARFASALPKFQTPKAKVKNPSCFPEFQSDLFFPAFLLPG
jgi:hypothetical protein